MNDIVTVSREPDDLATSRELVELVRSETTTPFTHTKQNEKTGYAIPQIAGLPSTRKETPPCWSPISNYTTNHKPHPNPKTNTPPHNPHTTNHPQPTTVTPHEGINK